MAEEVLNRPPKLFVVMVEPDRVQVKTLLLHDWQLPRLTLTASKMRGEIIRRTIESQRLYVPTPCGCACDDRRRCTEPDGRRAAPRRWSYVRQNACGVRAEWLLTAGGSTVTAVRSPQRVNMIPSIMTKLHSVSPFALLVLRVDEKIALN
eukprot:1929573-Prymnesium_polylepis.1